MKSLNNFLVKKENTNTIISLGLQVLPILIALIYIPLNLSYLGASLWGVYNLSISMLFMTMYVNFGIGPAVNRIIAQNRSLRFQIKLVHSGLFLNLLLVFIIVPTLLFLNDYIISYSIAESLISSGEKEISNLFFWTSLSSGVYILISYFRNIHEGKQNFLLVSILRALISSLLIVSPLFFSTDEISNAGFLIFIILTLFLLLYFFLFTREYFFFSLKKVSKNIMRILLKDGSLITIHSFVNPVFIFFDRFIIGNILGTVSVGIYTSIYDVVSRMIIVPSSISNAYFPAISNNYKSIKLSSKILFNGLKFNLIVSSIALIILVTYGNWLLENWLGIEVEFKFLIPILSLAYFVKGFNLIFLKYYQAMAKFKYTNLLNYSLAFIYFPLIFLSIKLYNITGAALILLLKNVLEIMINFYYLKIIKLKNW